MLTMRRCGWWSMVGMMILASAASASASARGDELRVVKVGQPIPAFSMKTPAGSTLDNASNRGHAAVIAYVSAEQNSSTKVTAEAQAAIDALKRDDIELQFVSADVSKTEWFRDFRDSSGIRAPLGLDFDRVLYGKLGIIVLPTTILVDKDGKLRHVIAGYKPDFAHVVDAYARHTLGMLDDVQLEQELEARGFHRDTPADRAARHRAAAALLREKGLRHEAEKELHTALEVNPEDLDARLDLASLCVAERRFDEARRFVDEVVKVETDNRRAKMLRGILLFHDGKYDEAEKVLDESLILNTDPARTHYYLGLVHEKKGQTQQAMEHYRQALERLLDERP